MYPSEATCLPVDLFQNQNNVSKWSDMSTCGLVSESEQCIQVKRHVYLWTCFRIRTMYPSEATCLPVDLFQNQNNVSKWSDMSTCGLVSESEQCIQVKRHVYLSTCFRIRTMYPSEATCLPVDLFQNQNNVSKWSDMSTCRLVSESEQCIQVKRHVYLSTCFRIRTMYPSEATCLPVDLFQNQNNVSKWSDMSTCRLVSESEQCIQVKRHVYLSTCFRIRTMYPSEATCLPVDLFQNQNNVSKWSDMSTCRLVSESEQCIQVKRHVYLWTCFRIRTMYPSEATCLPVDLFQNQNNVSKWSDMSTCGLVSESEQCIQVTRRVYLWTCFRIRTMYPSEATCLPVDLFQNQNNVSKWNDMSTCRLVLVS